MSKCVLKQRFIARCLDISHNKKLTICCSVDSWNAPPQSIHLCAQQLVPQALQDFRALTLLANMAEEENSRSLSDHWLLIWLCLWDLFPEHILLAKTEVNEKMAAGSEETWGKAQAEKHKLGFIRVILCQLCVLLLLDLPPSTYLKNTTTHFWSHNTFCLSVLPSKSNNFKIGLVLSPDRYLSAKGYRVQ